MKTAPQSRITDGTAAAGAATAIVAAKGNRPWACAHSRCLHGLGGRSVTSFEPEPERHPS
jgi:hypothetical protein